MKKNLLYYKRLNYEIHIEQEKNENENWFIAYCDELGRSSCYGTGDTPQGALIKFLKDKDEFIQYLYENDKPIPEPAPRDAEERPLSGFFNVRTSPQIHGTLVKQAKECGVSLNLYINQILASASQLNEVKKWMDQICNRLEDKIDAHHYQLDYQIKSIETPGSRYSNQDQFDDYSFKKAG